MGRQKIQLDLQSVWSDRYAEGMKLQDIASKYGVSLTTAFHQVKAATDLYGPPTAMVANEQPIVIATGNYAFGADKLEVKQKPDPERLAKDYDFNELYWKYRDFIGFDKAPEPKAGHVVAADGYELTVVASDLHVPYSNDEAIRWMVNRTSGRAKRLVLGGDIADMFYFSKYMKFRQHFTPMEELLRVQAVLVMLSEAYEEVWVLEGNHDDRFIKYFKRMGLPAEVIEVFEYLHGEYAMHPIYVLAKDLKNVHVCPSLNKDYAEFGYLHQVGDAVISHAEKYSKVPNKTVGDVIHSLKSFHEPQGVVKPFRVVVQAHTHMAGKTWNDYGVLGIENGCLAMTPDYTGSAKFLPNRAPVIGFTELWQKDGRSCLERTNFIPYQG